MAKRWADRADSEPEPDLGPVSGPRPRARRWRPRKRLRTLLAAHHPTAPDEPEDPSLPEVKFEPDDWRDLPEKLRVLRAQARDHPDGAAEPDVGALLLRAVHALRAVPLLERTPFMRHRLEHARTMYRLWEADRRTVIRRRYEATRDARESPDGPSMDWQARVLWLTSSSRRHTTELTLAVRTSTEEERKLLAAFPALQGAEAEPLCLRVTPGLHTHLTEAPDAEHHRLRTWVNERGWARLVRRGHGQLLRATVAAVAWLRHVWAYLYREAMPTGTHHVLTSLSPDELRARKWVHPDPMQRNMRRRALPSTYGLSFQALQRGVALFLALVCDPHVLYPIPLLQGLAAMCVSLQSWLSDPEYLELDVVCLFDRVHGDDPDVSMEGWVSLCQHAYTAPQLDALRWWIVRRCDWDVLRVDHLPDACVQVLVHAVPDRAQMKAFPPSPDAHPNTHRAAARADREEPETVRPGLVPRALRVPHAERWVQTDHYLRPDPQCTKQPRWCQRFQPEYLDWDPVEHQVLGPPLLPALELMNLKLDGSECPLGDSPAYRRAVEVLRMHTRPPQVFADWVHVQWRQAWADWTVELAQRYNVHAPLPLECFGHLRWWRRCLARAQKKSAMPRLPSGWRAIAWWLDLLPPPPVPAPAGLLPPPEALTPGS